MAGEPAIAARLAAIEAEYKKAVDEVEAGYQAHLKAWEEVVADPRELYWMQAMGTRPMTPDQAAVERDHRIDEARRRKRDALEVLERELDLAQRALGFKDVGDLSVGADIGGRPRKEHPGFALREAARMIKHEKASMRRTANAVTLKVRERVDDYELADHRWNGFTWEDADLMKRALKDRLVKWSPQGLEIRGKPGEIFRSVADLQWLVIPRSH